MRRRRSPEIIAGQITGATATIVAGDGFSVVRNVAGNYTITFAPGFRCFAISGTPLSGGSGWLVHFDPAVAANTVGVA